MPRLPESSRRQAIVEMVRLYQSGWSCPKIASAFGLDPSTVNTHLHIAGVQPRSPSASHRIYNLDEHAFSCDSPESRYWVGFLLADGCMMRSGKSYCIELSIAECDHAHIEAFRLFLKSNHPIKTKNRPKDNSGSYHGSPRSSITIQSAILGESLIKLGVVPGKTSSATTPDHLKNDVDFWRGVVDGDGHITTSAVSARPSRNRKEHRTYTIGVVGTQAICEGFYDFAITQVGEYERRSKKSVCLGNHFATKISGQRALRLIEIIYRDAAVALPRKLASAMRLLSGSTRATR